MTEEQPANVPAAFEMLLEEIEAEIDIAGRAGARAFEARDYSRVEQARKRAEAITTLRDRVASLRTEWGTCATAAEGQDDEATKAERRDLGRLRKGLRKPEAQYYLPILQVLSQMGGTGKVNDVLERVCQSMKPVLRDVDYQPLASEPHNPRWRNAAQWARNSMVHEGLLKADSQHGMWEITDQGRVRLRAAQQPRPVAK
jgi:hypothetical protein